MSSPSLDLHAEILSLHDQKLEDIIQRLVSLEGSLERSSVLGHELQIAEDQLVDLESHTKGVMLPMDASWVLTCATLVFLMQLGFAQVGRPARRTACPSCHRCTPTPAFGFSQLEAGLVRPRNVIATYMKNIIDFVLGALVAFFFGYGIAYHQWPLVDQLEPWKFFFHLVFQATASTIVSGALS